MTEIDLAAEFRGRYASRRGAAEMVKRICGKAGVEMAAESLFAARGMPEIPTTFAGRGDAVLMKHPRALGIVALNGREIVTLSREGLRNIPIREVHRAWRI